MGNSFFNKEELAEIGFKSVGKDVYVSRKASIYRAYEISIGNNVRIDDFCILSGKINIGNHVHISAGCYLFAGDTGIIFEDYTCISSRGAVYAITDDYSGKYLTNSTVDIRFRNVIEKEVVIGRYSVIGTGSTVLCGIKIGEGCSFGAMSLINKSTEPWGIYVGIPCKRIKERSKECLKMIKDSMGETVRKPPYEKTEAPNMSAFHGRSGEPSPNAGQKQYEKWEGQTLQNEFSGSRGGHC